ncbi:hypothetical protein H2203_007794 [Taxawa tesnikishii (nom. ined.)]|nr:hypothetical protein H2203_007794 [Dothideales sp. JES 119]
MTNIFDDIEDGENERLQGMRPPVIPPTKPASARTAPTGVTSSRLTDNPPANGDAPVDAVQDEDDTDDTENEAEPQRMYTIPAIPQGLTAPSLEELMILVHAHTRACGFDVVKKGEKKPYTSRRDKETGKKVTKAIPGSKMYKLELWCSFGGTPANTRHLAADQRKRNRPSMKLKCPSRVMAWSVRGKADPDGPWMIKHSELSKPDLHNHPPVDPIELPNHRRRARQEEGIHATIQTLVRDKTSRPEAVQKLYEQFADGLFTERDVNNEIQKARMAAQRSRLSWRGSAGAGAHWKQYKQSPLRPRRQ